MKFYALVRSYLDDRIDFRTFEAKDKEEAYEVIDEESHNSENYMLMDEDQLSKFFDAVARLKSNLILEELDEK